MRKACFALLLCAYLLMILPFADFMKSRPVEVKLGYLPHPQLIKAIAADHDLLVAEMSVIKVLFYYGTIVGQFLENVIIRPEHANMYRILKTATYLDPYNDDAYYFAQAAFTWNLGRVEEVNTLLERGAKYRTWDPWINFYLGFNYSYFLKDYAKAAYYYKRAGEISPRRSLFSRLAARYYYESDQTGYALTFLDTMIAQAKDQAVRNTYIMRRDALLAAQTIEDARQKFFEQRKRQPTDINELVMSGFLAQVPKDPYGGDFYLDRQKKVRSTSKFAILHK